MSSHLLASIQLQKWAVPKEQVDIPLTHVKMIGGVAARLHVPPADRRAFMYLMEHCASECIAEIHSSRTDKPEDVFTRLFFDMDMDKESSIIDESGSICFAKAMSIAAAVHQSVMQMFYRPCYMCASASRFAPSDLAPGECLHVQDGRCASCVRPYTDHMGLLMSTPTVADAPKVGFHLVYPRLVVSLEQIRIVCATISQALREILPYCAKVEVLDTAVYRPGSSLRMLGMDKPGSHGKSNPGKRYSVVAALMPEGENNTDLVERLAMNPRRAFELTSIRTDWLSPLDVELLKRATVIRYPSIWKRMLKRARSEMTKVSTAPTTATANPILPMPGDLAQALNALPLFAKMKLTGYKRLGLTSICVYTSCKQCPNVKKTSDNPRGEHRSRCLWIMVSDRECSLRCFNRKEATEDVRKRMNGTCAAFRLPMGAAGPRLTDLLIEKYVMAPQA